MNRNQLLHELRLLPEVPVKTNLQLITDKHGTLRLTASRFDMAADSNFVRRLIWPFSVDKLNPEKDAVLPLSGCIKTRYRLSDGLEFVVKLRNDCEAELTADDLQPLYPVPWEPVLQRLSDKTLQYLLQLEESYRVLYLHFTIQTVTPDTVTIVSLLWPRTQMELPRTLVDQMLQYTKYADYVEFTDKIRVPVQSQGGLRYVDATQGFTVNVKLTHNSPAVPVSEGFLTC
jgi:hypothetical protein